MKLDLFFISLHRAKDNIMEKKEIAEKVQSLTKVINDTKNLLYNTLVEIVRANGGLIKTIPTVNVSRIVATTVEPYGDDERFSTETIFGIREDKGFLYICTNSNVEDFESDRDDGFTFLCDYYLDEDEIPEMEKCLSDWDYFSELNPESYLTQLTLESILYGLTDLTL